MARPFKVEVLEDEAYLKKSLHKARSVSQKEKLQMLYWLKTGQVKQQQELGQRLGRDTSTVSRWLQKYRSGGLAQLLAEPKSLGKPWRIEGEVLEQLKEKLQHESGFKSYGEIVQWVEQTSGKSVKYQTVYKTVRYRLGAKLKVPRPRSLKQNPHTVELFKKTSR